MVRSHHVYRVPILCGENYKQVLLTGLRISVDNLFTASLAAAMMEAGTSVDSELFGLGRTESVFSK